MGQRAPVGRRAKVGDNPVSGHNSVMAPELLQSGAHVRLAKNAEESATAGVGGWGRVECMAIVTGRISNGSAAGDK